MSDRNATPLQRALQNFTGGRLGEAKADLREALKREPGHAHALHLLGVIELRGGNAAEAAERISEAIARQAGIGMFHNSLGLALRALGRREEAAEHYRLALTLDPRSAEYHNNLAAALQDGSDAAQAVPLLERAVALRPDYFEAHFNLGNALRDLGRIDRALACYDRALALRPAHPDAIVNRGMTLLLAGDYARGWEGYECRHDHREAARGGGGRTTSRPQWRGESLDGKTLLLLSEQGYGDTLQFVRYVPLLDRRGARVLLEVQPELHGLLRSIPGAAAVFPRGEPLPEHDFQCPIPSLPLAFGTRIDNIPAEVPYVTADGDLAGRWREWLGGTRGPRVGLVWAGRPTHSNDRKRSLALAALRCLAEVQGIQWVALQKGPAATQLPDFPAASLSVPGEALRDFADTAALIANLDLVIAVDTAVAHLTGALAKPVWILLPHAPDWRWLLDREDSPWYPGARLFRQPAPGDWEGLAARLRDELADRTWLKESPGSPR